MQNVQIQTIDACNSKCIKCPHCELFHTNRKIDDDTFVKIIAELKLHCKNSPQIKKDDVRIDMWLQNEPLMDDLLFKRVKFIKEIIPKSYIELSTNCLLLPKYKDEVIKHIDYSGLKLFGWDAKSYNLVHRTDISQEHYNKMYKAVMELVNKKSVYTHYSIWSKEDISPKDLDNPMLWHDMAYSRAGFLNGNKIIRTNLDGCTRNKHKYFNFLYDGTLVLCCMDYIRESVIGNIKHQSLNEIINSSLYKNMMAKVEGKIESKKDFICKRCELAKGLKI